MLVKISPCDGTSWQQTLQDINQSYKSVIVETIFSPKLKLEGGLNLLSEWNKDFFLSEESSSFIVMWVTVLSMSPVWTEASPEQRNHRQVILIHFCMVSDCMLPQQSVPKWGRGTYVEQSLTRKKERQYCEFAGWVLKLIDFHCLIDLFLFRS